ncbi:MAG: hypothetical protein IJM62_01350 [Lachnospiraceae bacterium]|nr:hypothetical protein [Lachnospiraceae bacterium]
MHQEQYDLLMEAAEKNAYMSIAVSEDGAPVNSGPIPWERTLSGFNMRTPKLTVSAADLVDEAVMSALERCDLRGMYIFSGLSDYGFISGFKRLQDLFICRGEQIRDLSFVRELKDLFMFYLEDASIPDLKPLIEACGKGPGGPGKCFGFRRCDVADTSALMNIDFVLSELLVWPVPGDTEDRWITSRKPGVFRFYEANE